MERDGSLRSFERSIVRHAAPTLAGMKPASLFTCPEPFERLEARFACCRARLETAGVSLDHLAKRRGTTLLLVSRERLVRQALAHGGTAEFLRSLGYDPTCLESCLACLRAKIARSDGGGCARCAFPHEIGLFLGYPFEDVMAFIGGDDAACTACGCWKAYGDADCARRQFDRLRSCTARLVARFEEGTSLEKLADLSFAA